MLKTTTISTAVDFATAEALQEYADLRRMSRSDALRKIMRQVLDPLGYLAYREPLAWEKVQERSRCTWILDVGPNAWVQVQRQSSGGYLTLTIEENGVQVLKQEIKFSPDEFALYLAESLLLRRWPHLNRASEIPEFEVKTIDTDSTDAGIGHWAIVLEEALKAA